MVIVEVTVMEVVEPLEAKLEWEISWTMYRIDSNQPKKVTCLMLVA